MRVSVCVWRGQKTSGTFGRASGTETCAKGQMALQAISVLAATSDTSDLGFGGGGAWADGWHVLLTCNHKHSSSINEEPAICVLTNTQLHLIYTNSKPKRWLSILLWF